MSARYTDWAQVVARYVDVAKERDENQLLPFIEDAEGELDARLAPRYAMPYTPGSAAPQIMKSLAIDLAYYRTIWATDRADKLKTYIDERINGLLAGSMALVTSGGVMVSDSVATAWTDKTYRSSFGPDDPVEYSVSSAWQDAAQNERLND